MSEDKTADSLANPILNSPYFPPEQHFELGPKGPTGTVLRGRRASESFIPVPPSRKGKKADDAQVEIDFDVTGERREQNSLINDVRQRVELWRNRGYPRVTPMTRKLLEHWAGADGQRDDHMLFCQREAAETAIYLAEVAGRHGEPDFRTRLTGHNETHNGGLNRTALKMATGSGKTVVMAMLIAWQTINKVATPRDARFSKRFLIVTPGITIRDRLRVLRPEEDVNYYAQRDLVPQGLWPLMFEAQIVITNYHSFLLRDSKEIKGVAANTRKLLLAGKNTDPFKETQDDMVSRVLRDFSGRAAGEIVVFNDEAHHCYQTLQAEEVPDPDAVEQPDREDKARNEHAGVWFRGLQAIDRKVGVKSVFDLSATPYYLSGSGYPEGYIFPWVVSDFSLMDSIESGIVKVPRMPVDDDAIGDAPTYLNLWEHIGKLLPKRMPKGQLPGDWVPPSVLEGALESLY
ncbi:MAG: DEAD/DEAH box helicase family protein, partial [Candidatus Microthrix parvicella]